MRVDFDRSSVIVLLGIALAGAIAWALFPSGLSRSTQDRVASNQRTRDVAPPDTTPFRYGPEINLGRGDTPVNARAQALKDAEDAAPAEQYRPAASHRRARSTSSEMFLNRGLKSGQ